MARPAIDTRIVVFVASDTIRHVSKFEGRCDLAHRLDFAVTFLTGDVLHDMGLMIEIDEVRKHVYFCPPDRRLLVPRFADLLNLRPRRRDELMTSHACLNRGNHRGFASARPAVTILAVHLIIPRVDLMTEGDRLAGLQFFLAAAGHSNDEHYDRKKEQYSN